MSWMNLCALPVVTTLGRVEASLIDRQLLRGLSVGLQGFLFVVILVHDGSIRLAHDLLHHLLGHRNWALHDLGLYLRQDLRHENGDLLDVWSGGWHFHLFRHVHCDVIAMVSQSMASRPCETFISRGMYVGLICCVGGVLWCLVCQLPTDSVASQARVYCGC